MKIESTLAVVLILASTLVADEPATDKSSDSKRVEVQIRKSTTQKDDEEPKTKVEGRIVLEGPDWKHEFDLGDELPKDFPLRLKDLGPDGIRWIQGERPSQENNEPRFMIGISCQPAGPALATHLDIDASSLIVTHVIDGLPADEAGIEEHDILLQVNGRKLKELTTLIEALKESNGKTIEIAMIRDGKEITKEVRARKMTATEAREAMRDHGDSPDRRSNTAPGRIQGQRNWIMGPGIRIEDGMNLDIREMIREAREQALKRIRKAEGIKDESREDALRKKLDEVQKQMHQLRKRLEAIEED